ncbi:C40 family peptidase [Streptomonospora litoralis]|uniref:Murein DD-endopeptidase MepH n=1 Tax=Streptomonospora litoralis TaxID=2498135 RepID=A0A4P6PZX6_9ACTN|nr:NlpC/P60 family protein [Streptomonospora litoralis]QBI52099.1 Murein DD-endopeptidase MepH precursor [Streptomonospora litoralis]
MNLSMGFVRPNRGNSTRPMTKAAVTLSSLAVFAALALVSAGPAAAEERVYQASSVAGEAVEHAKEQIGKPYRWGAEGPGSFDCSGLVQYSYKKAGKRLSRTTYTQFREGRSVSRSNLRPGDLVFFYSGPSHVGMYVGNGRMIHAPSSGKRVQIVEMAGYYNRQFVGARRVA